jgi:hypothetical protein
MSAWHEGHSLVGAPRFAFAAGVFAFAVFAISYLLLMLDDQEGLR